MYHEGSAAMHLPDCCKEETETAQYLKSETALKLFVILNRASKVIIEEANQLFDAYDLNPTEFAVLELLYHKGDQPIQKIGQKILMQSGSMTYVVDKLEKRGLLKRVASSTDKRVTFMSITPDGRKLIAAIFPVHQKRIVEMMSVLSEKEAGDAIQMLRTLGLSVKDLST